MRSTSRLATTAEGPGHQQGGSCRASTATDPVRISQIRGNWAATPPAEAVVGDLSSICEEHDRTAIVDRVFGTIPPPKNPKAQVRAPYQRGGKASSGGSLASETLSQVSRPGNDVAVVVRCKRQGCAGSLRAQSPARGECESQRLSDELSGIRYAKKITGRLDVLLAFYDFPLEHWINLRTTNPIGSTFSTCACGPGSPAAPTRAGQLLGWPTNSSTPPRIAGTAREYSVVSHPVAALQCPRGELLEVATAARDPRPASLGQAVTVSQEGGQQTGLDL